MSDERKTSTLVGSGLLLGGLLLAFIGERVVPEDLRMIASGGGGLLCLAALAMRAVAMGRSSGDSRAVEGRILASYIGVFVALGAYAASTDAGLELLGFEGEGRTRAGGVLSVLWSALMLTSVSVLLFMEQVYVRMPLAHSVELRRVSTSAHAGLMLALSVIFLMSMNFVASERDVRKDVSYFKVSHPSDGSLAMVKHLDQDVRVILFWERANDVLGQVRPYFDELSEGSGRIQVDELDFDLQPQLAREHKVKGNGYVLLVTGDGDKEQGQAFEIGTELTRARKALKRLDGTFQQHFAKVVRPERSVYLTAGHAERTSVDNPRDPGEGSKTINALFQRLNLKNKKLSISEGLGAAVPDGSSAVIIAGPREKFMPAEVDTLIKYVREGGRLLMMVDPGVDNGLAPLLEALGLELMDGVIASERQHMRPRHGGGPSDRAIVFSNAYTSHPTMTAVMRNQRDMATVFYRGVAMKAADSWKDQKPKPKINFPLKANGFWRDRDGNFERDAGEGKEMVNMIGVVSLKGDDGKEGRAVVIGDGDFMTDRLAANNGNMLVFVDSLAWLIGNEELVGEVNNEEDVAIRHSREEDKMWFYATTFAVPLPIVAIGLWNARRRRRRSETAS